MNIFNIFKKKKQPETAISKDEHNNRIMEDFSKYDYLGKAAEAGQKAKNALKAKEFDKAWGFYHEQKIFYLKHANRSSFTKRQMLALDSQVHEDLANILRIEKKDENALTHILYWVIANNDKPIKRHQQKLSAYFNRCKFLNTSLEEATNFATKKTSNPEYLVAQSKVAEWQTRG